MTYTLPLRLTILHFSQRFFTEEDTFMISLPYNPCFVFVLLSSKSIIITDPIYPV